MGFLKKLGQSPAVQNLIGSAAANYFRLVHYTSSYIIDPPDIYETIPQNMPLIYAMWHGEHFMTPFANPYLDKTYVLISRHRDGEINALAASKLGARTIRGSGTHRKNIHKKGGVPAFREMLTVLKEGYCVAMTADVPKVSRVAGQGIVRLAAHSGCPILPVAVASSRRWQLDTWDDYRNVARLGRKTRLPEPQRAILWEIIQPHRSRGRSPHPCRTRCRRRTD